jgi:hypothetical protein
MAIEDYLISKEPRANPQKRITGVLQRDLLKDLTLTHK